jgi:hypothetical protein
VNILRVSADGTFEFKTINEAISRAQPHTRILVSEGVYNEAIVIDKPLEIISVAGPENTIIENTGNFTVLMQTSEAIFRGFTVRGYVGTEYPDWDAFKKEYGIVIPTGKLIVEDCHIWTDLKACVSVFGETAFPTIRNCKIFGKIAGIYFYDKAKGLLEDSEIFGSEDCLVSISQFADPVVRNCDIHSGRYGVASVEGKGVVENCKIHDISLIAVSLVKNSSTVIRRSKVYDAKNGIIPGENGVVEDCELFRVKYVPNLHVRPMDFKD